MPHLNRLLAALILLACAMPVTPAPPDLVTCSGSNTSLSLGLYPSYNPVAVDSATTFLVNCVRDGGPKKTTVTVGLGPSFNSGTIASRQTRLTTGSDLLNYNLYRDAARVSVWGETISVDTVSQVIDLPNNGSGTLTFNIFARINALQDVREGTYTDQVTITVTF